MCGAVICSNSVVVPMFWHSVRLIPSRSSECPRTSCAHAAGGLVHAHTAGAIADCLSCLLPSVSVVRNMPTLYNGISVSSWLIFPSIGTETVNRIFDISSSNTTPTNGVQIYVASVGGDEMQLMMEIENSNQDLLTNRVMIPLDRWSMTQRHACVDTPQTTR
jgi:hypothetical protein